MNILKISKFPPIEGGESSKAFWITRELCKRGINIFLLTNAFEVENMYRSKLSAEDIANLSLPNFKMFNTSPFNIPKFIPYYNPFDLKLISKGIEIIENQNIDIIEGSYLLPYGFVASYLSKLYDLPLIISHAGSDITRLLNSPHFSNVLNQVLKSAHRIITFPNGKEMFQNLDIDVDRVIETKSFINTDVFCPIQTKSSLSKLLGKEVNSPIISHFGKMERGKGVMNLIECISKVKSDFTLIFFGNGRDMERIQESVAATKIRDKTVFHEFIPPWKMPLYISSSDCILSVEHNFGVNIHGPILPREAMSCGTPVLISNEIGFYKKLEDYNNGVIKVNPGNDENFTSKLTEIIENKGGFLKQVGENGRKWIEENIDMEEIISERIKTYDEVV